MIEAEWGLNAKDDAVYADLLARLKEKYGVDPLAVYLEERHRLDEGLLHGGESLSLCTKN